MKHRNSSGNWPLWLLIASVCMMLALVPRELAIRYGFDKTISNVVMLSSIGILIFLYAILVEALVPMFNKIFHMMGFRPKAKTDQPSASRTDNSVHKENNLVIDYATARDNTLKKQEVRIIAIEEKVIHYVAEVMSPYVTKEALSQLIENVINFFHMSFKPEFNSSVAIKVSDALSTTDLMHFGWNIAKPFRKPCAHTALFLKQVFADTFRNTELETIEKKLRLNPLQGVIKINKDICGDCQSDVKSHTDDAPKPKSRPDSKHPEAKRVALADMLQEDITIGCMVDDLDDEGVVA
ncbi:MAG: hypothetical protein NC453_20225 [Muribaculum sp.]|nr:hypothetical protein [Muribaculum sp.]